MTGLSEWITPIGILVTATVAMVVAFIPSIRRRYNRPKFAIEFENERPFCRVTNVILSLAVTGAKSTTQAYWVRLRVRNVGRSVAKNCKGKLVRILDAKTMKEQKDFDPIVLRWVGETHHLLDINQTEYEYLDVLNTTINDDKHFNLVEMESRPRGINLTPERKDYILHIILYGENVKPLHKSFYLKNHKKYDKIELSLTKL